MKAHAVYCLSCWGHAHQMSLNEWIKVVDAFEEDGVNQVYFWLSGLFRSKIYPQTFIYYGAGMDTKDIHELIKYVQKRGMEFFLGTGIFAWLGLDEMVKIYPEVEAKPKTFWSPEWWSYGLCPSHPKSREINLNYCLEMADEFSEADGFYLEIRDEYGPCVCEECNKLVGDHGERGYGSSKASFLEELSAAVWKKHPNFKFVVATGYLQDTGEWDTAYYDWILRRKSDSRWSWLNARWAEKYPGLDGKEHPFTELSDQIIYWSNKYHLSVMDALDDFRKWEKCSNYGVCYTFEPGARWTELSASKIPDTLESVSTKLYRVAFKEFCKNPEISSEEFKGAIFNQLFKPNEDKELLEMLLSTQKSYLGLIGHSKLQEKVEAINFYHLLFFPGSVGHRDAKAVEKALREIRDLIEKNKQSLSKVHNYLKTKELIRCAGLSLLKEGSDYCHRFTSEDFLKKLDIILEYYECTDRKREKIKK